MPLPNETNPPDDPATRLARIQDWSFQSGQAYKEIKWLRDFLRDKDGDEFADALRRVERVKKYVFFAGQMTPEPPPPPEVQYSTCKAVQVLYTLYKHTKVENLFQK